MQQFVAYRNRNPATEGVYPFLLNVQSDLIKEMETRVMIPLLPLRRGCTPTISALTPVLAVNGTEHVLMTPLMAGMSAADLGTAVTDLATERSAIIASLDLLISGI